MKKLETRGKIIRNTIPGGQQSPYGKRKAPEGTFEVLSGGAKGKPAKMRLSYAQCKARQQSMGKPS